MMGSLPVLSAHSFANLLFLACIQTGHTTSPTTMPGCLTYRRVPKFSDARKLHCNVAKFQTKRLNHRVFRQKNANGIANSADQSVRKLRTITI